MKDNVLVELSFPKERQRTFNRLMLLFSKYGEEALKDCSAVCSTHNKNVVYCWDQFTAATIAYNLGKEKLANVIYNHIENQLSIIYKDEDFEYSFVTTNAYVFGLQDGEDYTDYIDEDNLLDYAIKGTLANVTLKDNSKIAIVTKIADLGILDYSVISPLERTTVTINNEELYLYTTVNSYDAGVHRIKFITKTYE